MFHSDTSVDFARIECRSGFDMTFVREDRERENTLRRNNSTHIMARNMKYCTVACDTKECVVPLRPGNLAMHDSQGAGNDEVM